MDGVTDEFYPLNLFHSRYNGTYSGGRFILIAGIENPKKKTAAVGSDTQCTKFWQEVEESGPIITRKVNGEETEIYASSGQNPSVLFEEYSYVCENRIRQRVSQVVTEVVREYPDVFESAKDNKSDFHKLNLVCEGRYRNKKNNTLPQVVSQELLNRFIEYDSIPKVKQLSAEQKVSVKQFKDKVIEEGEELDLSIAYHWTRD